MAIKFPSLIKHLIKLLGEECEALDAAETGSPSRAPSRSMSHRAYLVAFKTLLFVADSLQNLKVLLEMSPSPFVLLMFASI